MPNSFNTFKKERPSIKKTHIFTVKNLMKIPNSRINRLYQNGNLEVPKSLLSSIFKRN